VRKAFDAPAGISRRVDNIAKGSWIGADSISKVSAPLRRFDERSEEQSHYGARSLTLFARPLSAMFCAVHHGSLDLEME
jgi:hypothetical protein